jgi:NodT family efflux transporter outer membrane factor (OMF) lipoprotein
VTRRAAAALAACVMLAGCVAGPDYVKPTLDLPPAWTVDAPWRESRPDDASARGPWWRRFGDERLDALEQQALAGSPTLAVANARLLQARATLAATSSGLLPQVGLGTRAGRQRISANRPLSNYATPNFVTVQNDLLLAMTVNYEVDLAGRVQRTVEAANALAQQSAADLENTRLLLTTDLATAYFNLRATDIELDAVRRSIDLQERTLQFVSQRHDLGVATGLDVAQQQALLDNTRVQVDLLRRQRAQFEHAIAALAGVPAPGFAIAPDLRENEVPAIPIGVPSDVLERRPDVASAERAMAAANAQIGVASSAFFPSVTLGANYGVESRALSSLFEAPSVVWSVGVAATQVLFDNGRIRAGVDFARAGHAAAIESYRRTVLVAMQEAEDGITGVAALDSAFVQARVAVGTAARVLDMATARYEGGASTYLDVITAQQALLAGERQAAQLRGQRLVTTVFLVKALGGGWTQG